MERRKKPDGGFRFIGAYELLWVYFAFSAGQIRWYDLRVWFACQEAVASRCRAKKGVPKRYRVEEIKDLVGGASVQCMQGALKRLQGAGLLRWSTKGIAFAKIPAVVRTDDGLDFWMMVEDSGQANRKVPVPRRTIRYIAGGTRKVLTATMLGHILRCCYWRGEYLCEGSCSASWIGRVFGLNVRNVKIARKHLVGKGWLLPAKADAWHRQRYGARAVVNPSWAHESGAGKRSKPSGVDRSPRIVTSEVKRSPLLILKGNSFGFRNQKPASPAGPRTGVCSHRNSCLKTPTWKHVELDDLRQPRRTLALFGDAVARGLVSRSEADWLNVMAAAEHALRVGERNPCGLFVSVVTRRLWHHLTLDEEDAARRRIHELAERGEGGLLVTRKEPQTEDGEALPWLGPDKIENENSAERLEIRKLIQQSLASAEGAGRGDSVFDMTQFLPSDQQARGVISARVIRDR